MTAPLNRIGSHSLDEVEQVDGQVIRQLRQRLLLYQILLSLAPLLVVPVAIVGITIILGVEPLSLTWYAHLWILLGAITYCGYLQALLACKRRGRDPRLCRGKLIGSTIAFTVFHCTVIIAAGVTLFIEIVSHPGAC